jgi:hypothetical protein
VSTRVVFFDPEHGIGLRIAAGSGRSWQDQPGGDPVHAHCTLDVPRDTLLPSPTGHERPASGTLFVPWTELTAFTDDLERLRPGRTARLVGTGAFLAVRMRRDGRLRAEARFTTGHHVTTTVHCRTRWDWHHGTAADLPALTRLLRAAPERPAG